MTTSIRSAAALAVLFLASACGESDAAGFGPEHRVSQEQRPTEFGLGNTNRFGFRPMGGTAGGETAQGGAGAGWTADAPAHWQLQSPDPSRFRDLRWFVDGDPKAEVYLTAAVGGSLQENVGRWYDQFGHSAPSMGEILSLPQHELMGAPALLIELAGTFRGQADTGALLLVVQEGGDLRRTFRCTAPKAITEREKAAFLAVAKTIRPSDGQPAPAGPAPSGPPPMGGDTPHGADPMGDPHGADPHGADPHGADPQRADPAAPFAATIPSDWTPMGDTGSRLLRYRFGTQGELYTGQLGGSLPMMLGIWCAEIGAPTPDAAGIAKLPKVPMLGGEAVLLDLRGDHEGMGGTRIDGARLLVAVVEAGGGVVFAKCLGPAAEVDGVHDAFLTYCKSLRRTGR
ncbi:MAG: hypothetical protein AB7O97_01455 [Planctomycetota bacterium]